MNHHIKDILFGAKKNNHFLEFEWVFEGCGLAHGYIDENDSNIVLPRFQEQLDQLPHDQLLEVHAGI